MKTLTAFYDLAFGPVSFDFTTWLVRAMKERDARGCKALHAVVVPLEGGLGGFARHWGNHDEASTRWRIWHIVVAACPLAGATVTLAHSRDQATRMRSTGETWWPDGKAHFMGPLVDAARRGEPIPKLRATDGARRYVTTWLAGRKVVTLTVRRQSTDPDRNSNLAAWQAFAEWLQAERGKTVVLIDEANDALADGRGYAELDPDLRLALYEQAEMNVIGNNGPQELLKFSAAPYLIVGLALTAGWAEHFKKYFNMDVGEQLPWAGPKQRLVYRADSLETLKEEFSRC